MLRGDSHSFSTSSEHMPTNSSDVVSSAPGPFQQQSAHEANSATLQPAGPLAQGGLEAVLSFINAHKVQHRALTNMAGPGSVKSSGGSSSQSSRDVKWIQPSGPRRPGEGVENEEQGIISAEQPTGRVVVLRITLLAAGFIIGPSGSTVRDIMRVSGCDIKSWTEQPGARAKRPCRVFVLEGEEADILSCIAVVTAAIDRYKELCEGRCCGQTVGRVQRVMGVEFSYQPPPKNIVPFAAALKGHVQNRPLRLPSSSFDALLQQQQPQPGFMLTGNGSGSMAPYFGPYSSLLIPPPSPTMLPYPAMYGLAMPSSQSLPASHMPSSGGDGDYGGGSMMCGYDYSHVLGLGGGAGGSGAAAEPAPPPGGIYLYPGSPMPDASGAGPPGSPSTGSHWVAGSSPGMMLLPGMMMPPPSPIRYHGMPAPTGSVPMGVDPMSLQGIQGPFLGCPPMTPELSWQMGMHGTGQASGGGSNNASAKMSTDTASTPSTQNDSSALGSNLGAYDFMAPHHQVYGQPLMTWYGNSPAGMVCSPSGAVHRGSPPSPYSHMMTMMPFFKPDHAGPVYSSRSSSYSHSGTNSRLNPRAAPWGQSQSKEHLPQRQEQPQPPQLQPASSAPAAPTAPASDPPPAFQRQDEQQRRPMDEASRSAGQSASTGIDSNKENQSLGSLSAPASPEEPGVFLAKTPKRPSLRPPPQPRSGGAYPPWLPSSQRNMSTPPRSLGTGGMISSCGSCSADTAEGRSSGDGRQLSSAPATAMVSPADPLISPSRFSNHRAQQQRGRTCGSSSRYRQPNFAAAVEGSPDSAATQLPAATQLLYHSNSHPQLPAASFESQLSPSDNAAQGIRRASASEAGVNDDAEPASL